MDAMFFSFLTMELTTTPLMHCGNLSACPLVSPTQGQDLRYKTVKEAVESPGSQKNPMEPFLHCGKAWVTQWQLQID